MNRRISRIVKVGKVEIGGTAPISVQSMLNTPAHDLEASVAQAKALENAGCDIIRAAVPDKEAVKLIYALKEINLKLDKDVGLKATVDDIIKNINES